jgi:hypothetical protein
MKATFKEGRYYMEQHLSSPFLYTPRWHWMIVAFCLFVLFHLLPFFYLSSLLELIKLGFWTRACILLFSIGLISIYAGYRARGKVWLESAFAAVIYILALKILLPSYLGVPLYFQNNYFMLECLALGFTSAFAGAGIGVWWKLKREVQL